ncbi:hypothetical protein GR212_19090 [Rhizobium lusitanum]|uniref:Uncharacterized protein n=1 Tax=Rhizobium lusitanum TaxID=293958 RepID=A0A6L9U703_9HYPH|nr:hypothetical protein [Rhizobium lusitanum]NEI71693.1 hypothetical protein [Rhizobium lusitanum]
MFKTPKSTIVFAVLGTTFAALAASSVPSFAASTCAGDLRLTRTELRDTPNGQQKSEAMGLYSAAMNAHDNGQEGRCLGDINRADAVLTAASDPSPSMYPFDPGNVGVDPPSTPAHHHGDHGDHGHGHDHGRH